LTLGSIAKDWTVIGGWNVSGDTVVRHVNYHDQFNVLLRTNRTVVLALLWAALAACVLGSLVYDVADWVSAW
jgi:hypothetical protein